MNEELRRLLSAARQLVDLDRALGGGFLPVGRPLPEAATPAGPTESAPAPARAAAPRSAGEPERFEPPAGRRPPGVAPFPARQIAPAPARPSWSSTTPAPAPASAAVEAGNIPPPDSSKWMSDPEGQRRQAELDRLADQLARCQGCRLCPTKRHFVFGEGSPLASVMFVGEAPGEDEDLQGRPFVGRAGALLTNMISAMGLSRSDVYIANVLKCRPPGNRAPQVDEVAACWDYLRRQLLLIRPKVIVSLGNPATHALLHTTEGITKLRGRWQRLPTLEPELEAVKVMPTFHPAFVLRSYTPDTRKKVWSDLQEVMKELGLPTPKVK